MKQITKPKALQAVFTLTDTETDKTRKHSSRIHTACLFTIVSGGCPWGGVCIIGDIRRAPEGHNRRLNQKATPRGHTRGPIHRTMVEGHNRRSYQKFTPTPLHAGIHTSACPIACRDTPCPQTEGMTHTCESTTFPQLLLRVVKITCIELRGGVHAALRRCHRTL